MSSYNLPVFHYIITKNLMCHSSTREQTALLMIHILVKDHPDVLALFVL